MGQEKELKPKHRSPDPELLKKLEVLKEFELLMGMREMGLVPAAPKAAPAGGKK